MKTACNCSRLNAEENRVAMASADCPVGGVWADIVPLTPADCRASAQKVHRVNNASTNGGVDGVRNDIVLTATDRAPVAADI